MTPKPASNKPPFDLAKYRNLPALLMVAGGIIALIGLAVDRRVFAYSWLLGFMLCLSLCLGALFLVIAHHLFDAGWSVPIRRFCEHIAALLFPWMAILFIPIVIFAKVIYDWMDLLGHPDHALKAKHPLFTVPGFYVAAAVCFGVWWLLTNRLRYWSVKQDETGAALPTYKMRTYSAFGIFLFAITLTLAAVMWIKALEYEWFSTMYGVYYFAGSVWMTLATAYVITGILDRQRVLTEVLHEHQYYFIGSLMFAFTVFYAYIHLAQYFIIWNGNMPEETFWYLIRESGVWWWVGLIIIFGHFFIPFLALLRIDVKNNFYYMAPLCAWAWLMHWVDLSFNIMPKLHPSTFPIGTIVVSLGCAAFMIGFLAWRFLIDYAKYAPYPLKDPRLIEAMGYYHPVPTQISGGELDEIENLPDALQKPQGGHR